MITNAKALKNDLLSAIVARYERGAAESTEEASTYVLIAKRLRDHKIQVQSFKANLEVYADIQDMGDSAIQKASEDTKERTTASGAIIPAKKSYSPASGTVTSQQEEGTSGQKVISASDVDATVSNKSKITRQDVAGEIAGSIDDTMSRIGDRMQQNIDRITKYSTKNSPDIHGSVLGTEVRNSALTMFEQMQNGNIEGALKAFIADCIPCADRMVSGFQFGIATNFQAGIESDIQRRIDFLNRVFDFSTNKDVYDDICSLINTLNFMCVPDLVRIISLLMFLLTRYSLKLKDFFNVLQGLVSAIFKPLMIDITSLFDQYGKLVLDVVNCIIDAMQSQLAKLGTGGSAEEASETLEEFQQSVGSGLQILIGAIREGESSLRGLIEQWTAQLEAFLLQDATTDSSSLDFLESKLKLIRLIDLIQALINFKQSEMDCPDQNFSAEQLSSFVNTMDISNASGSGLKIVVDVEKNQVVINDQNEQALQKAANSLAKLTGAVEELSTPASPIKEPSGAEAKIAESLLSVESRATITVNLDDCLYSADGATSERVQQWISELSNV